MSERVDAVVIGMGPGGEDVAGRLAQAGLDVVAVERDLVGGECPYWGCVPSKMAVRAANLLAEARRVTGMAEVGSVGLSEGQAREAGMAVRIGQAKSPSSARGWIHKAGNEGSIKLVADDERGVLVGAMSAGPAGGEVLGLLTLVVHAGIPVVV